MLYYFLLYFLTIIFFAFYFKKKNYFSNYSGDSHQLFSNEKNIPLVGGIFLVIPILSINYNNVFYILIIFSIFMLGFLSDRKVIVSAKQRFLFQIILILFSVIFLDLKILSSRILFFDNLLELFYFNILFTCFCLLILINGSNFIDGLNGLLLIYMTTVLYVLIDTSLLSNTNLKLFLEIDGTYILF